MRPWWGDVNARARGMAAGLPDAAGLRALAGRRSPASLGRELAAAGLLPGAGPVATAGQVDGAVRRWAAGRLALLERRLGSRRNAAARVILEEEDRRSLRALLRGAAEGARPAARLAGTVPTRRLTAAFLEELARAPDLGGVAAALRRAGHPAAPILAAAGGGAVPDLFRLEIALDRLFAARAVEGARGAGPDLEAFVAESVDVANAWSAIALSSTPGDVTAGEVFIEGGSSLPEGVVARAMASEAPTEAARVLADSFAGGPLEALFAGPSGSAAWERRSLELRIARWSRRALLAPLGPAPFLAFTLRLRAVVVDVSRLAWAAALGAPASTAVRGLGGPR